MAGRDDAEDDLAFDVEAGVVIPSELWCMYSVANPDDGSGELGEWSVLLVETVYSLTEGELDGAAICQERIAGLLWIGGDAYELDLLEIGAVVASWLESRECKLGGDVLGCDVGSPQAGAATFKQIVCEKTYMGTDAFRIDAGLCSFERWRNGLRVRDGCTQSKQSGRAIEMRR